MIRLSERMSRLGTETAFEVLVKARALEAQGRSVVHLEIGEPDFDTPKNIVEAAVKALREGWTHYGPAAGLPELREAIAEEIHRTRGWKVTPDQVVVTPGGKPIMFFSILALVDPGDEVIYPNPGFPIYESMIRYIGATPVPLVLREQMEFRLDVEELRAKVTDRTKLIIINSPQNPTGSVLTKEDVDEIGRIASQRGIPVLSDEIYSRILYEGSHESVSTRPGMQDLTILLDGFSKTYAMTGWRMGYGVMNRDLAALVARLMTNSNSCTASFTQRAGIEALRGPQEDAHRMVEEFRRRRDIIVDGLNSIPGMSCVKPKGAFYVFPNIRALGKTAKQMEELLLNEAGVAALAGTSFGASGEGYIRFSYANSIENIRRALEAVRSAAAKIRA